MKKLSLLFIWPCFAVAGLNTQQAGSSALKDEESFIVTSWLSFPEKFFDDLSEDSCFLKSERTIKEVMRRAESSGSTVALYNYGGWSGEPEIQIRIKEHIGAPNLKMVYNFHHAHVQTNRFAQVLEQMLPYLSAININGMRKEGPKIIPVGKGDLEAGMPEQVCLAGFRGLIGILDIKTASILHLSSMKILSVRIYWQKRSEIKTKPTITL